MMMRDEMANLVWGIEKRVQGSSGEAIDRKFESTRLATTQSLRPPAGQPLVDGGALLHYRLQTPVAANWRRSCRSGRKGRRRRTGRSSCSAQWSRTTTR